VTRKLDALLHGHSTTAHPIGCAVANKTLDIVQKLVNSQPMFNAQAKWAKLSGDGGRVTVWSLWDPDFVHALSYMPMIAEVMTLGTVLAIKFKDEEGGKTVVGGILERHTDCPSPGLWIAFGPDALQSIKGRRPQFIIWYQSALCAPFGINYRTLGNVAYFMTSLQTPLL